VIFATVGTQLPFDRMIAALDEWAGAQPGREVFAQVGPGEFVPRHIEHRAFIAPAECRARMFAADAIVAHAGMGTILTALEMGKPLLVVPRRASLGEHRNDHQLATARRFAETGRLLVAFDEHDLADGLDELQRRGCPERISPFASDQLITALRRFIDGDDGTPLAA
jgi:UDP-N-acetylglucosamine transferase subunit ALG13